MSIYGAAIALCGVEEECLTLKETLCDGSMLKGHTAKQTVNKVHVTAALERLKTRIGMLEEAVRRIE